MVSGDPVTHLRRRWLRSVGSTFRRLGVWLMNEVRRFETSVYNFSDTVRELSGSSYVLTWAPPALKLRRDRAFLVEYELDSERGLSPNSSQTLCRWALSDP